MGRGPDFTVPHPLKSGAEDRREKIRLEPVKLTRLHPLISCTAGDDFHPIKLRILPDFVLIFPDEVPELTFYA